MPVGGEETRWGWSYEGAAVGFEGFAGDGEGFVLGEETAVVGRGGGCWGAVPETLLLGGRGLEGNDSALYKWDSEHGQGLTGR